MSLFGAWALLPVTEQMLPGSSGHRTHLLQVKEWRRLIHLNSFYGTLRDAVMKMCSFHFDESVLPDTHATVTDVDTIRKMHSQLPNASQPNKVLSCLILNINNESFARLTKDEALAVLQYISDNLDVFVKTAESNVTREQIKRLPIFVTHDEKIVALSSCSKVCSVPNDMPYEGIDDLSSETEIVMLKAGLLNKEMRLFLDVTESTVIDIYLDNIIPQQLHMSRQAFYHHVQFLAITIYKPDISEYDRQRIISCMTNVRFIETADGMKKVNELFDSRNKVFQKMCQKSEFLPEELQHSVYIDLFKSLGLQDDVKMEFYIRSATEIAGHYSTNGLSQYETERSQLLVKFLLGMPKTFHINESFDILREIKFIVPERADDCLLQIHKQHNCDTLISFAESVLHDQLDICWTTTNVLPSWANPHTETKDVITKKLKVCERPSFATFINHCKHIGISLSSTSSMLNLKRNPAFEIRVTQVMTLIYQAFIEFKANDTLDGDILSQLKEVPMIYFPEEKIILTASCVVNQCHDDEQIPPFLQKSPSSFGQFFDVFLLLGASKKPSCDTFARVLQSLKLKSDGKELLPPELVVAKLAISNMLVQIGKHSDDTEIQVTSFFLLNFERKMQEAKQVVVCDNAYLKRRLANNASVNFFIGFDALEVKNIREDESIERFKRIPQKYRPTMLTEIVGEEVQLPENSQRYNSLANELTEYFHCNEFISGIVRLIKHISKLEKRAWSTDFENRMSHTLRNIIVRHVEEINTVLTVKTFENGAFGQPQKVANTCEKKAVHIEETDLNTWVYLETSKHDWYEDVKHVLTVYLNKKTMSYSIEGISLMILLLPQILNQKGNPKNIEDILDKNIIDPYDMTITETDPVFPKPGTFVPVKFHAYLDNDYGLIHEHDYKCMVYLVEDPAIPEGDMTNQEKNEENANKKDEFSSERIAEEFDDQSKYDQESAEHPTYIYCRILQLVEQNNTFPLFQKYEVDIGEETTIIAPAYRLYKFTRKEIISRSTSTDIVAVGASGAEAHVHSKSLKEIYKEIRKHLNEAWKMDEKERKYIILRLIFKWHPDKNLDNVIFCTKVSQYIQQCLVKLGRGLTLSEDDDSDSEDVDRRGDRFGRRTNEKTWYSSSFENMGRRYRSHGQAYRDDEHEFSGSFGSGFAGYSDPSGYSRFDYRDSKQEPYHFVTEARRWQKQARSDFRNANDSMAEMTDPSYNWICYKYHQSAEKSLKAAWYAKDANKIAAVKYSHELGIIAQGLDPQLTPLAEQLSALTGKHTRMRYPDMHSLNAIPADAYNRDRTNKVRNITDKILNMVASTYKINV